MGYFIDNEQPWRDLKLFEGEKDKPFRFEWEKMIVEKYKDFHTLNKIWNSSFSNWEDVRNISNEAIIDNKKIKIDADKFEDHYANRYFLLISSTLKKYDPNHLYLGCRFTRRPPRKEIVEIAGKYCDVISLNVYSLVPAREEMELWYNMSGKPLLIGEHHLPLKSEKTA
ncbi:MAG: hypothetical protein HC906_02320 [Bacteroidales bacterium]|nr:hypothetical protein [Bacteroidales bacterium]